MKKDECKEERARAHLESASVTGGVWIMQECFVGEGEDGGGMYEYEMKSKL